VSGRERRFRVDSIVPDGAGLLDPGAAVHRHLRVLRAAAGDTVLLFDGRGGEARAEIATIDEHRVCLRAVQPVERAVESPLELCLVQALPARAVRMETIVRQVTELGVQRIVPVLAQRSQAKAGGAAQRRRAERWRRIADAAAEQCGRTRVPRIEDPCALAQLHWGSLPRPLLIADPGAVPGTSAIEAPGGGAPDGTAKHPPGWSAATAPPAATVMVGPEGGWAAEEVDAARVHGAAPLGLGPRVLRTDSAGVVAVTLLQARWGDLQS
jgi:16S rRNA (uracil1498-N3)-methyltransferase